MSLRDITVSLRHMYDHVMEAMKMAEGKVKSDLELDRKLNLSLTRLLEIVGEAASRIPKEEQIKFPEIPWGQIIGLRHRLIHGYDQVDFDILWQIITSDLPPLAQVLKKTLTPKNL